MKNTNKIKEQLIIEIEDLNKRIVYLEKYKTECKQTEKALMEKTAYLDGTLHSSTEMAIAITDLDLRIRYFNPMMEKFHNYKAEEVIGRTVMEMHIKDKVDPSRFEAAIEIVKKEGAYHYKLKKETEGGIRYFNSRVSGVWDDDENLIGFVVMHLDITERKQA